MVGKVRSRLGSDTGSTQPLALSSQPSAAILLTYCVTGQSQFLTTPVVAKPLQFSELTLDDPDYDQDVTKAMPNSESRLLEMLAAQAQHHGGDGLVEPDAIADDEKLSENEKKKVLQRSLAMAASNGDVSQVKKILDGKAKSFVDVNGPDEDGTPPLVYASCFVREQSSRNVCFSSSC
jgi:hypothetical protein